MCVAGGWGDGACGRDAAAVAGGGAGDVADDRADAFGGCERYWATVRQPDLVFAGGEVSCAVRAVSHGGDGVSGGAKVAAVRGFCAGGAGLSVLHGDRFSGGREVVDLSALHSG